MGTFIVAGRVAPRAPRLKLGSTSHLNAPSANQTRAVIMRLTLFLSVFIRVHPWFNFAE